MKRILTSAALAGFLHAAAQNACPEHPQYDECGVWAQCDSTTGGVCDSCWSTETPDTCVGVDCSECDFVDESILTPCYPGCDDPNSCDHDCIRCLNWDWGDDVTDPSCILDVPAFGSCEAFCLAFERQETCEDTEGHCYWADGNGKCQPAAGHGWSGMQCVDNCDDYCDFYSQDLEACEADPACSTTGTSTPTSLIGARVVACFPERYAMWDSRQCRVTCGVYCEGFGNEEDCDTSHCTWDSTVCVAIDGKWMASGTCTGSCEEYCAAFDREECDHADIEIESCRWDGAWDGSCVPKTGVADAGGSCVSDCDSFCSSFNTEDDCPTYSSGCQWTDKCEVEPSHGWDGNTATCSECWCTQFVDRTSCEEQHVCFFNDSLEQAACDCIPPTTTPEPPPPPPEDERDWYWEGAVAAGISVVLTILVVILVCYYVYVIEPKKKAQAEATKSIGGDEIQESKKELVMDESPGATEAEPEVEQEPLSAAGSVTPAQVEA